MNWQVLEKLDNHANNAVCQNRNNMSLLPEYRRQLTEIGRFTGLQA